MNANNFLALNSYLCVFICGAFAQGVIGQFTPAPGVDFVGELKSRDPRGFPFNHTNFGVGNQTISNLNACTAVGGLNGSPAGITGNAGNAGQIFAIVGTSRQIQLGLKFIF